jgi:hypothetical protein
MDEPSKINTVMTKLQTANERPYIMQYSLRHSLEESLQGVPKPLSNDLRKRIIDAKLIGDTEDKMAKEKEVCKNTLTKLWALYRETSDYHRARPNPNGRKTASLTSALKNLRAAAQNREYVRGRRAEWKSGQPGMDVSKLVFLDKSGINTGMTRPTQSFSGICN